MNCPHCQRQLPDPSVANCPFCGMPVNATAGQDPYAGPTVIQGAPGGESARPEWNQPPGGDPARPEWNQPPDDALAETVAYTPPSSDQPPAYTPPAQQPPAYTPPAYTPPVYNQPQQPAYGQTPTPGYGQPQQPAYGQTPTPGYGQPQQPAYGAPGMQPNYQAGYTGAPVQQKKRNWTGCLIGCLVVVVLLVVGSIGGVLLLRSQTGGLTIGGATIGGSNTGPGGGTIIYQDALNGSTKADWTDDSNCFFGSGGYHINAAFICYAPSDKVGDGVTTVSVKQISGPITYGYGLVIRRPSKGNYYEFLIDANGKWLFDKVVNGTTTDIVKFTANSAIKKGLNQVNVISVSAKGSHFVFSVNGTQVGTADDTTFTSGDTGLSGNDGIEVVFTDLSIANVK